MDELNKLYYNLIMKMKKPKFSPRMIMFSELALPNVPFWDVCCDHGYIGINALLSEKFTEIHFVDHVPHIMVKLENLLKFAEAQKLSKVKLHVCEGEKISQNVFGNIIIAGVSGRTIVKILKSLKEHSRLKAKRLLLSPHLDHLFMENFLANSFAEDEIKIIDIVKVNENDRIRPIYIVDLKNQEKS